MWHNPFFRLLPCLLLIGLSGMTSNALSAGGIVRDGSLPGLPPHSFKPLPKTNEISIQQSDGITKGSNLFHSFGQFNIARGQTVTFYEDKPGSLENVISRVTGNSRSDINGKLAVTPEGKANFYLINPNGIIFGPGSSVDIKGSIHVSTADYIKFRDGNTFSAAAPDGNTLSSAAPSAFGFLGTSARNNGLLKIDNTGLLLNEGKSFDGVANNIIIVNSNSPNEQQVVNLDALNGDVRLISIQKKGEITIAQDNKSHLQLPAYSPTSNNSGTIELNSAHIFIDSGSLTIWGEDIIISNSSGILVTNSKPNDPNNSQGVIISVGTLSLGKGSTINTFGKSSNILINAAKGLHLNNGSLFTKTNNKGDTGKITVNSSGKAILTNSSEISTGVIGFGGGNKAGNILINADKGIILKEGSLITTTHPGGGGGSLGNIELISTNGDLNIISDDNSGESKISTTTNTNINAGDININVKGNILLSGGRIDSSTTKTATGNAGSILIKADANIVMDKGANLASDTAGAGKGGRIRIQAGDIRLTNSQISTRSTGIKAAGNIDIFFRGKLSLDPSFITTEANQGDGGDVTIKGGKYILLKDSAIVTTVKGLKGNGGNITINADNLVLDTGIIQANTQAIGGSGGNIDLRLGALIPSGNMLTIGETPVTLQPGRFGFNFIQATAPNGINGTIQSTAPQLNLSGEVANLGSPKFDSHFLSQDYCNLGTGSSLTRFGKGGLLPMGRDNWIY